MQVTRIVDNKLDTSTTVSGPMFIAVGGSAPGTRVFSLYNQLFQVDLTEEEVMVLLSRFRNARS